MSQQESQEHHLTLQAHWVAVIADLTSLQNLQQLCLCAPVLLQVANIVQMRS